MGSIRFYTLPFLLSVVIANHMGNPRANETDDDEANGEGSALDDLDKAGVTLFEKREDRSGR